MAGTQFIAYSGDAHALTAPLAAQTTSGTASTPKTIQQLKSGGAGNWRPTHWGYIFTSTPASPVIVELIDTSLVGATVTAQPTIQAQNAAWVAANPTAVSNMTLGTAATGYNASAEGAITATRLLDMHYDNGGNLWVPRDFPLGRECEMANSNFLRVRATSAALSVPIISYVIWEE